MGSNDSGRKMCWNDVFTMLELQKQTLLNYDPSAADYVRYICRPKPINGITRTVGKLFYTLESVETAFLFNFEPSSATPREWFAIDGRNFDRINQLIDWQLSMNGLTWSMYKDDVYGGEEVIQWDYDDKIKDWLQNASDSMNVSITELVEAQLEDIAIQELLAPVLDRHRTMTVCMEMATEKYMKLTENQLEQDQSYTELIANLRREYAEMYRFKENDLVMALEYPHIYEDLLYKKESENKKMRKRLHEEISEDNPTMTKEQVDVQVDVDLYVFRAKRLMQDI